ncbi:sensor histidine kinase [Halobellus captivus]|uniref:sensor histidine kinase n=1 Tax=Halobellus captivus TaxID=2592614 RepID=UPI0019392F40|nr:HAMP domain-containing sensor histidine kinase [Halobellus captivus]
MADRALYTQLQTGKGWAFVAASSVLMYLLISRREAELAEQNSQLERALQQISILHRILRHNLRNSCNVVTGYVDLLKEGNDVEVDTATEVIESHVEELVRLSEKSHLLRNIVLDGPGSVRTVDLTSLLEERIAAFQAEHPDVAVETEVPKEQFVSAHSRLADGIDELFENAVKHNDANPPRLWVSIRSEVDDTVDLDVADNGPGVPEIEREVVEKGEEKPLFHSQGLGLWIARASVVESGGEIRFVDNDPRGSIARITLPKAGSV